MVVEGSSSYGGVVANGGRGEFGSLGVLEWWVLGVWEWRVGVVGLGEGGGRWRIGRGGLCRSEETLREARQPAAVGLAMGKRASRPGELVWSTCYTFPLYRCHPEFVRLPFGVLFPS